MLTINEKPVTFAGPHSKVDVLCYHCGTPCISDSIAIEDKAFCCDGCKLVYEILNENGLCDYYKLQSHPGLSQIKPIRNDKYSYLDNEEITKPLYKFTNGDYTIVTFYIPGVHCSSCMWLLEHLHKVNSNIIESRLNFTTKEVTIHFSRERINIRAITELLATIGYEPYISLDEVDKKKSKIFNKQKIYKLGVAGFCFGNIMMMSFPEYLSHKTGIEDQYSHLFRYLNLLLAIPVFFYSASEFFVTAWKGLQQKILNIDAPIALAIVITFARSVAEIATNTGAGYLDSMSGIVFFMLVGRVVQERTYKSISFHRDYKSYFPIAVNVITKDGVVSKGLQDLKEKDIVQLHNDEIIPADSIVVKGNAYVDYSFVTGENEPVTVKQQEMVYAGGKQAGGELVLQVVKPVAGSYLTSLWNHYAFSKDKQEKNDANSAIHMLSRYFTWVLLSLTVCTGVFWAINDPSKIMVSTTAMLIVACPCALLLTSTFTNGNLLRIFSNNGLFLRDATVIEQLSKIDQIVFDKTGTLTQRNASDTYVEANVEKVKVSGYELTDIEKDMLYSVVCPSQHPYSNAIATWLGVRNIISADEWKELSGKGLEARINGNSILVGSYSFVGISNENSNIEKSAVYVKMNDKVTAFDFSLMLRESIPQIISSLREQYQLSLLSGDNDKQRSSLSNLFSNNSELLFEQKPIDKLQYIETLQQKGKHVMMIGDGLNDAGALQQSNVGITLADDINNFTPSCDAILDSKRFALLPSVLKLAKASKTIIGFTFFISILYNFVGLYFAMCGLMKPMTAAILMPCSTLTIVLITSGMSSVIARSLGLSLKDNL
ncbi:MAG: heavy metal translocating P-type ATPase metal-binding domain-containing protein [Bacteroidota bacterium]